MRIKHDGKSIFNTRKIGLALHFPCSIFNDFLMLNAKYSLLYAVGLKVIQEDMQSKLFLVNLMRLAICNKTAQNTFHRLTQTWYIYMAHVWMYAKCILIEIIFESSIFRIGRYPNTSYNYLASEIFLHIRCNYWVILV